MENYKSRLQKDKNSLNDLLKDMKTNEIMFGELTKKIDHNLMNNLNEEKMNRLMCLIKEIEQDSKEKEVKPNESKGMTILNQEANIGDYLSLGEPDNMVSSYSLNDFQVQAQPKISIETTSKTTKKMNYMIKSMNPIHEITPSVPLNNTPITQMNKPIEQVQLNPNVPPENMNELQAKMSQAKSINPPPQMPNYPSQLPHNPIQLQMIQQSLQPQMRMSP